MLPRRSRTIYLVIFVSFVLLSIGFRYISAQFDNVIDTQANEVEFSPDGHTLAAATWTGIELWHIPTQQHLRTLSFPREDKVAFPHIAWSADSTWIVAGGYDGLLYLWRASDGVLIAHWPSNLPSITALVFHPYTSVVAVSGRGSSIELWDVHTQQLQSTLTMDQGKDVHIRGLAFSPDGTTIVAGTSNSDDYMGGRLRCWETASGRPRWSHDRVGYVKDLAISPDGAYLAVAPRGFSVELRDLSTGQILREVSGHEDDVDTVTFTPNSRFVAAGASGSADPGDPGLDPSLRIWRVSDGQSIQVVRDHTEGVRDITFDASGQHVAVASRRMDIRLWRVDANMEQIVPEQVSTWPKW